MLYFAYGSNMLTERLRGRVPSAQPRATAPLPNHALQFHKRSRDGSGKCSFTEASDGQSVVYGVVFEVDREELSALDEAENRGYGYERRRVSAQTEEQTVQAFAYVAQPAYVDDSLLPYDWYRYLVVAGAHQHGLPSSYRDQLTATQGIPDPNTERRLSHRALLRDAGFQHLWPTP